MSIPTDPIALLDLVDDLPRMPTVALRGHIRLGQTATLLQALRLSASAEMAERGFGTECGNPIDYIVGTPEEMHPLTQKLIRAMTRANRGTGFEPRAFSRGDRVRLAARPDRRHNLPTSILVGSEGLLLSAETYGGVAGWQVRFDALGSWWTTTESLELI